MKWSGVSVKGYISPLMEIGRYLAMDEKTFNKMVVEKNKMSAVEISNILIKAFGDGK